MSDDLDATLIVPDDPRRAIEVRFPESAYRFHILERAFAAGAEGTLGNYVLLGSATGETARGPSTSARLELELWPVASRVT